MRKPIPEKDSKGEPLSYRIVSSTDVSGLQTSVNSMLSSGYFVCGGVSHVFDKMQNEYFIQAMQKKGTQDSFVPYERHGKGRK